LEHIQPATARDFFALSAEHVRRELVDLARHFFGPRGLGTKHASDGAGHANGSPRHDAASDSSEPAHLLAWSEFHEQVSHLPPEQREVVDLLYYQELPQAEAAQLLGVNTRTVQRRWHDALLALHDILQHHGPEY